MKKFFSLFLSLILMVLVAIILFFLFSSKLDFLQTEFKEPIISQLIDKKILITSPLKLLEDSNNTSSFLTQQGVVKETNKHRKIYGLSELKENFKLNAMAQAKVEDMFEKEYFAHNSPSGEGVGNLAENFKYDFFTIGENLAMGNFENDEVLVTAWMESPEHKANMLNPKYKEIGVAVQRGIFDGKSVWLAVQHFGLSTLDCSLPDESIKKQIIIIEKDIKEIELLLTNLQIELKSIRQKWGIGYQQKIDEYNNLVEEYNSFITENKTLIEQYNSQVNFFNNCIGG